MSKLPISTLFLSIIIGAECALLIVWCMGIFP